MAADPKAILSRYESLRNKYASHWSLCQELAPYIAPSRGGITTVYSPGQKQTRHVFDSTTMQAGELLAHFIASYSMNPSQQWGAAKPKDWENAPDELLEWYEECTGRVLQDFDDSLFYSEGPEMLIDWVGFGTGCLFTDEAPQMVNVTKKGWRGSFYKSLKTGRFVIAEGPDGLVHTLMYEDDYSAGVLRDRFGNDALPANIKKALEKNDLDKSFCVVHAVYPRSQSDRAYAAGAKGMAYASCWVEKESKALLAESGYEVFPAVIPRHQKTPGEIMGRGRGHLAFPDTWSVNQLKRLSFEGLALNVHPPIMHAHDSVIGKLRLVPGGPTVVNTRGRSIRDVIAPYETGSRPEIANLAQEDMRKTIRQIFFVDQILMLMEVNKSEMTAYEFAKKMGLLFSVLGPVYGRLRKEALERLWHIKFIQMGEAGAFSPPPQSFFENGGARVMRFENPLERAQRAGDVESIGMALQDMTPMLQAKPELLDWFDADAVAPFILKTRGVPARVTNSKQQVKAIRREKAAQQANELQLEQAGQMAEAAGKAAPMLAAMKATPA